MFHRKLTEREREILSMIHETTFYDIVDAVRKDVENSRYEAKKQLRILHSGGPI